MENERQTMITEQHIMHYGEGAGAVAPTGEISDEVLVQAVYGKQADIQDEHVVCIDEREALEAQPVRNKMAGGNVTTGFAAAELADWSLYTDTEREAGPTARVNAVANYLVQAGEKLGGHIDNHATDEKSNCGAADGYPAIISELAKHGNDIEFISQMRDALGEHFNQSTWQQTIDSAAERAVDSELDDWSGYAIINAIREHDGVVEVLNGDHQKPEQDPENARHNHWAEGVALNTVAGKSNDRDQGGVPFFQADAPKIVELCQKMAKDEAEFGRLLHAAVGYQLATRYKLTSNQRNVIIGG